MKCTIVYSWMEDVTNYIWLSDTILTNNSIKFWIPVVAGNKPLLLLLHPPVLFLLWHENTSCKKKIWIWFIWEQQGKTINFQISKICSESKTCKILDRQTSRKPVICWFMLKIKHQRQHQKPTCVQNICWFVQGKTCILHLHTRYLHMRKFNLFLLFYQL